MASVCLTALLVLFCTKSVLSVAVDEDDVSSSENSVQIFDGKVFQIKFFVPRGGRYCLSHRMKEGETLDINFAVVQNVQRGNLTLAFTLMDEVNSNILVSLENVANGEVNQIVDGEGGFEMCFFNDPDKKLDKLVIIYMNSYKKHNWDNTAQELSELDVVTATFKESFDNTQDRIEEAIRHTLKFRMQESSDLALLEKTLSSVNFWSFTYCLVIGAVSILQVYFVRILFDKRDGKATF